MEFLHSGTHRAGFYRNRETARAESIVIKHNAANGPARPVESAGQVKARMEEVLRTQGNRLTR
ncbi:MAG: hypothetical protein V4732_02755 [Pseudomonadota bacterium]